MGLTFDFGPVGHGWATTTSGFCLLCVVGLGFDVMGMDLLNRCLAKSMGVVGWFNFGDWLVVVVPEL